jgi:triosephosphate isomerase
MKKNNHVLLAGNWKMNFGRKETVQFLEQLPYSAKNSVVAQNSVTAQMRLYVPFLNLETALATTRRLQLPIQIGAQNVFSEKSGAFTGEISAPMLQEIGIEQVLIGHSERRQYFGETDDSVLKRTVGALNQGLEVLLCIGETLEQRNQNQTQAVLRTQLEKILKDPTCLAAMSKKLHLAYEPVWAIGTGVTATPAQAEEAHAFIRSLLSNALAETIAEATLLLYGGSVTPANFKELLSCPNINGGLVGGSSLKVESWSQLWDLI